VSEPHTAEQLSARRGDPEGGGGSAWASLGPLLAGALGGGPGVLSDL